MKKVLIILLYLPFTVIGQNINYSEHIAPIIYNKCLKCHHNSGIGPFSLETYANTVSNAGMIDHVVSTGEMPPWPPDTLFSDFSYENTLSMDEINKIASWITNGVPLGDTTLLPTTPTFSNTSELGIPDLELQIPTYSSNATSNSDDYVCFSIPTGLLQNKKIKAIEVIPGNIQIVHHVLVSLDMFTNNTTITTPNCMGPQGGLIYSYAPGSSSLIYPETDNYSFGVNLPANSSISLAMHYPEGSFGQLDSTKVRFYFYPQGTIIREISNEFLINEGLFGSPFYIPPNQITEVTGSYGPTPEDYSLMSVFPHMHLLGKDLICYAVTPSNDTINLIRINKWDFEWQGDYYFKKFIKIPAGSIIYARGNYDNTVSPSNPNPVMTQSGFNTQDEMFVFIFQYMPYELGDENLSIDSTSISTFRNSQILNPFKKRILKISDATGRETPFKKNIPLFYIYDNGTIEKKIVID